MKKYALCLILALCATSTAMLSASRFTAQPTVADAPLHSWQQLWESPQRRERKVRDLTAAPPRRPLPAAGIEANEPRAGGEFEGEAEERGNWLYRQRAYPQETVPGDGRERAWQSIPQSVRDRMRAPSLGNPQWRGIGPVATSPFLDNIGYTSGRIEAVAVAPDDAGVVLLGTAAGGIFRSRNEGGQQRFAPVADDQTSLSISSIAFAASNPNIVYASTGDDGNRNLFGNGLLKSTDKGLTWQRIDCVSDAVCLPNQRLPAPAIATKVVVDPRDANRLLLVVKTALNTNTNQIFNAGVYRSIDGGVKWSRVFIAATLDVAFDPSDPDRVYAAARQTFDSAGNPVGAAGVYRSTDAGATFFSTRVLSPPPNYALTTDVRVTVASNGKAYALLGGTIVVPAPPGGVATTRNQLDFYFSTSGGDFWNENPGVAAALDPGQFGYNVFLAVHPQVPELVYVGLRDVYVTSNGGGGWTNLTTSFSGSGFAYTPNVGEVHPDQQSFAFDSGNLNAFYLGNDGGLYRSTNNGATFQSLNDKFDVSITQFTGYALDPDNRYISYGGTQDNGTQQRGTADGLNYWREFLNGDGGNIVMTPSGLLYPSYVEGRIYRQMPPACDIFVIADNNTFAQCSGTTCQTNIGFYPPLVGNRSDNSLYVGADTLHICTSCDTDTTNWFKPGGGQVRTKGGSDVLSALGVERSRWNNGPGDQVIYMGSAQGALFVSDNGGGTATDRTAALSQALHGTPTGPGRFVTDINVPSNNPATAFLTVSGYGTDHVFKTTDTGATWTNISDGPAAGTGDDLPNIPVNCIYFLDGPGQTDPNTLYAGTDLGIWRGVSADGGSTYSWSLFNAGMPPAVVTKIVGHSETDTGEHYLQAATYGRGAFELVNSNAFTISGRISNPTNASLRSVTVTLSVPGVTPRVTYTNASGVYAFGGLTGGVNYTVAPTFTTEAGSYSFTPANRVYNNLSDPVTDANFTGSVGTPPAPIVPKTNGKFLFTRAGDGEQGIYTVNADGSQQQRLTTEFGALPVWSPDGAQIAFVRVNGLITELRIMNADGSNSRIAYSHEQMGVLDLDWSPDGAWLLFCARRNLERTNIFTVRTDGTGIASLSSGGIALTGSPLAAAWSPDGLTIAFAASTGPSQNIWLIDAGLSGFPSEVTRNQSGGSLLDRAQQPYWTPDGRKILYLFQAGDNFNRTGIYSINPDGAEQTLLIPTVPLASTFIFFDGISPDGAKLLYSNGVNGGEIRTMNLDGSNQTMLTFSGRDPDWQPVLPGAAQAFVAFDQLNYTVDEAAGHATISVTRFNHTGGTATVNYEVSDTAGDGPCTLLNAFASQKCDYTKTSGTLRFAAGETRQTFEVMLNADAHPENREKVNLTLSAPTDARLAPRATATLTILDDDGGPPQANPVELPAFFVNQNYADFLSRAPDAGGLAYWTSQITQCGADEACIRARRIGVSAAFFIELEFQESGAFVYRLYKAAYGAQPLYRPSYEQFSPDRARVVGSAQLEQGKLDFANLFVSRPEFTARYPANLTAEQFVDAILQTVQQGAGLTFTAAERAGFVAHVNSSGGRGLMMKNLGDNVAFKQAVFNRAFVLMQYFGYLRRDPDQGGYEFWLGVINGQPNNLRGMVCAFLTSQEFQERSGSQIPRSNAECAGNP